MENQEKKELALLRVKEEKRKGYSRKHYEKRREDFKRYKRFFEKWNGKVVKGVKLD